MRIIIDPAEEIDLEIADDQKIDMRTESDLQTDGGAEAENEISVTEVIIVGKSQADQRA